MIKRAKHSLVKSNLFQFDLNNLRFLWNGRAISIKCHEQEHFQTFYSLNSLNLIFTGWLLNDSKWVKFKNK